MRRAAKVDAIAIIEALDGATIAEAARELGTSRATLCRRMLEHGISANPLSRLVGCRFGRWTIIEVFPGAREAKRTARVTCDCGQEFERSLSSITGGSSRSCGCLRTEKTVERSTKHGLTRLPEYVVWQGMRQRCSDPNASNYPWYGALGVSVCDRWSDFSLFLSDMGERPTSYHSIDRINAFGNYEPGNCRWATSAEQAANKRSNYAKG